MEKIDSFKINHLLLLRGLYVSRKDNINGNIITTFDIRQKEPNRQKPLKGEVSHTIEHLAATYIRNHPIWKDKIIYWGPMGCLTGHYFIAKGDYCSKDILSLMIETFDFIANFSGDIPGATPEDCGNYTYNNLNEAKIEAKEFLNAILLNIKPENLNYPN